MFDHAKRRESIHLLECYHIPMALALSDDVNHRIGSLAVVSSDLCRNQPPFEPSRAA
jgi:hypothetical protein